VVAPGVWKVFTVFLLQPGYTFQDKSRPESLSLNQSTSGTMYHILLVNIWFFRTYLCLYFLLLYSSLISSKDFLFLASLGALIHLQYSFYIVPEAQIFVTVFLISSAVLSTLLTLALFILFYCIKQNCSELRILPGVMLWSPITIDSFQLGWCWSKNNYHWFPFHLVWHRDTQSLKMDKKG